MYIAGNNVAVLERVHMESLKYAIVMCLALNSFGSANYAKYDAAASMDVDFVYVSTAL